MPQAPAKIRTPVLAIVGRPNVGKSTIFNRLIGSRRSIVGDEPGITRDRLYGDTTWNGQKMRVIDTGGIIPGEKEFIPSEIFRQARVALEEADAIVLVVDVRTALASSDMELARLMRKLSKPLFLAVNKVDSEKQEAEAENFRTLGIDRLFPISAEHGRGIAELLEAVVHAATDHAGIAPYVESIESREKLKEESKQRFQRPSKHPIEVPSEGQSEGKSEVQPDAAPEEAAGPVETKVAIIGRPNVGKSTMLNVLTGSARAIVSPIAGTTRDAVDETIERNGLHYRFIDTAGIRRKGKTKLMAEKLSVVMARKHLEAADVALLIIDAAEGVAALDATIGGYAHESGRSVIIVVNKWDLVNASRKDGKPPADRDLYERQVRDTLKFLDYAPMVFVSASIGKNIDKLFKTLELVASERRKRIGTAQMNRFLETVDFERAAVPHRQKVKIFYMTQAYASPPTFILFTDKDVKLHFSYERFLQNQIRKEFGFVGSPIWIKNRPRSKVELPEKKRGRR